MQFSYEQIYNYFTIGHARKTTNLITQLKDQRQRNAAFLLQ